MLSTLAPYQVLVHDHRNLPVQGVEVRWIIGSGGGKLSNTTSRTDVNGIAESIHTFSGTAGSNRVEASVAGLIGDPVAFHSIATPGNPVALSKVSGDAQVGLVNFPVQNDYVVSAHDAYGNSAGISYVWTVTSGGGSVQPKQFPPGQSNVALHVLGPEDGPQRVTVTAAGGPVPVQTTFTAIAATVGVEVFNYREDRDFYPDPVAVPPGKTVGWIWWVSPEAEEHSVTFEDDATEPASSPLQRGGSHWRTFNTPGTYRYRCKIHSSDFDHGMVRKVFVY